MNTETARFDPILASDNLKAGFIDYITTTFYVSNPVYKNAFRKELEREGFLTKGPFLDMNGSYQTGRSLRELMSYNLAAREFERLEPVDEKDRELKIERPLYLHQENALLKADAGNNLIVTTGTGSGKTECFLLPILQSLLCEIEEGTITDAVRAILIYPMNALANDQMKRMRKILKNYPQITFGIYTGNTEQNEAKAKKAFYESYGKDAVILDNEKLSRDRMRETPPHILITNYSMLEYMMLRPKDDKVFSGAKLRYIVLDEAHVYRGTTGMETAMLMRRLRARISTRDTVQYILTSATLGDEKANHDITEFGRQLCGVEFREENIIRSRDATPAMNALEDYPAEFFHLLADTANKVGDVLSQFDVPDPAPGKNDEEKLYELMLTSRLFSELRKKASDTMEINQLARTMNISKQQLLDLVAVCSRAEKGKTSLLKARIHYFVRALEGAYVTLGSDPQVMLTRKEHTKEGKAVFEIAVCQDCGRIALVGRADEYLTQISRKTDRDPKECEYFLLWDESEEGIVFEDEQDDAEEEIETSDEADYVVCNCCGRLDGRGNLQFGKICDCDNGEYIHVRKVNRTKSGKAAKCPACGQGEFRAFYLGNEAATSVLGTELFEQLPRYEVKAIPTEDTAPKISKFSFGKVKRTPVSTIEKKPQFLCFSDSRSEAAYFAVYMETAYKRFLRNRGIWKAAAELADEGTYSISVPAFVDRLVRIFETERTFDRWEPDREKLDSDSLKAESKRNAWFAVINEIYTARHATSLSSVGLLHFEYASEAYLEAKDDIIEYLEDAGLSKSDANALMQRLFMDGVYTGALDAGKAFILNDEEREAIFFAKAKKTLEKVKGPDSPKNSTGWAARQRKNGFYPNTRNRRVVTATNWDESIANEFLEQLWEAVLSSSNQFSFNICDFRIILHADPKVHTWKCEKCGHITAFDVQNRCPILQCGGMLTKVSPEELQRDNHYVNRYCGDIMKPLLMREHTAQLSRNCQTKYQQAFVDGKINALSCSTTFEMGVDVGGLETVFMRDVPPGPANYVQRAGRAGRAAHTAAYVLTYAKLSSHDFTFYNSPDSVISGKIKAPVFTLENEKVLYRHIFAVAIAEFLASNEDVYDGDNRNCLVNEDGFDRLVAFLNEPSERLTTLLKRSVPQFMHEKMGISDGTWRERLVGADGVLRKAVMEYRAELSQLEAELRRAEREKSKEESIRNELWRFRANREDCEKHGKRKKSLIEFLTRNNVLPKYGFPVDTVDLQIGVRPDTDSGLQLSRDLQMAIAEYAPGSQIIADGKMYTSRYIRKAEARGKNDDGWEYGYFAKCRNPDCGETNFSTNPVTKRVGANCISCDQRIPKNCWIKTLEPRMGFITADPNGDPVPMRRPERDYKTDDYYVGAGDETVLLKREFVIGNERIQLRSTKNDSLAVVGLGEHVVCPLCGYATNDGDHVLPVKHNKPGGGTCKYESDGVEKTPIRLSHVFKTDVASVTFCTPDATDYSTMVSVLYAMLEGLSRELDIERTDIKGCLHKVKWEGSGVPIYSIILYDAVAGGAGHVRRIVTDDGKVFSQVLERAYQVVNNCKCDPSCYSCIRNYYNQKIHDDLNRKKAAGFLRLRLGECIPVEEKEPEQTLVIGDSKATEFRNWTELFNAYFETDGADFDANQIPMQGCLIMPDVKTADSSFEPYLVWPDQKIMMFDEITENDAAILGQYEWKALGLDCSAEELRKYLEGEK